MPRPLSDVYSHAPDPTGVAESMYVRLSWFLYDAIEESCHLAPFARWERDVYVAGPRSEYIYSHGGPADLDWRYEDATPASPEAYHDLVRRLGGYDFLEGRPEPEHLLQRATSAKGLAAEVVNLLRRIPPYLVPEGFEVDLLVGGLAFVGEIRAQALPEVLALLNISPPLQSGDDGSPDWVDICRRLRRRRPAQRTRRADHIRKFARRLIWRWHRTSEPS